MSHDKNGRFAKGNPGRPKGAVNLRTRQGVERALVDIDERWKALGKIASDPNHHKQFEALKLILAYAHGQPKAMVHQTVEARVEIEELLAQAGRAMRVA